MTDVKARTRQLRHDIKRNRVGVVMEDMGGQVYLRPMHGGREWRASADELVPVSEAEALSMRVAEANRLSREGR